MAAVSSRVVRATRWMALTAAGLLFAVGVYLYAAEDAEIGTIALAAGIAALLLAAIDPPADGWRAALSRVDARLAGAGRDRPEPVAEPAADASPDPPDRASAPPS
jgi:hypothetical protein